MTAIPIQAENRVLTGAYEYFTITQFADGFEVFKEPGVLERQQRLVLYAKMC